VNGTAAMQTELPETKISGITACTYWCDITLLPAAFLNLSTFRCEKCNKLDNMGHAHSYLLEGGACALLLTFDI
jgi:hypothetical protein